MSKKKIKNLQDDFIFRSDEILNIIARHAFNDDCVHELYEKVKDQLEYMNEEFCYETKEFKPIKE